METVNQAKIQKTQTKKPSEIIGRKQNTLSQYPHSNHTTRYEASTVNENTATVTPTSVTDTQKNAQLGIKLLTDLPKGY